MNRILQVMLLTITLIAAGAIPGRAVAQSAITLTGPASETNFAEGDDFATTVVGNPWDMNELRDIPYDINYEEPSVSNGIWTGVSYPYTIDRVGYYYPLFRGHSSSSRNEWDYYSYYDAGMPYGPLNPIDASRYSRLSIRQSMDFSLNLNVNASYPAFMSIFWFKTLGEDENNGLMLVNADRAPSAYVPYSDGFRIYDIDLTGQSYLTDRLPGIIDPVRQGGTWDGMIYEMRVFPFTESPAGMVNKIDWIRLYNPATSSVLPIRWTTTGVTSTDETYSVQLFLDSDAAGYDGDLFMTGVRNDGQFDLYTAALPPGVYYAYLRLVHTETTSFATVATSGYSPKITIRAAPTFQFTSPSFTSGVDYATTELANPWDMASAADVISNGNITGLTMSGGILRGTADPPLPGDTESDCYIFLNTKSGGDFVPIDTTRYRYLTFRMLVDSTGYTNILDRIQRGWLTRFQWAKTYFEADGSYSKGVYLLEGWHTYTADLWDDTFLEPASGVDMPQTGWRNIEQANYFRLDPLEVYDSTVFSIDDVKLCAFNAPANDTFTIRWQAADADGDALTVTLYYGYYDGAGSYQQYPDPIAVVADAQTVNSCAWNTADVSPGEYYIRAVVSDGVHQFARIGIVPVIIGGGLTPVPADFDADGKTDYAVYDESAGEWTITLSGDGSIHTLFFGGAGYTPLAADFDGDEKADPAIYATATGHWQVKLSASGYSQASASLGGAGYTPLAADFDGDGKSDLGAYAAANGSFMDMRSASGYALASNYIGGPGYVPASGDFNGDGLVDPAVYNATIGRWEVMWQVMLMRGGYAPASASLGGSGYDPVSGDYDGDGKADLAVYQSSTGNWRIMLSANGYASVSASLGGDGYQAVSGDFDGDGKTDPAVYSETTGYWTMMLSASGYAVATGP